MRQFLLKLMNCLIFIHMLLPGASDLQAQPEGYELIWHDEFDGTELDTTKWKHRGLGPRRSGTVVEDAVFLDGEGHLLITTTILDSSHYYVGMIGTGETFNTTYGYFECRAKFGNKVPWDSFWLQCPTAYQPGPTSETGAEIDIFEFTRRKHTFIGWDVPHNIHWVDERGNWKSWGSHNSIILNVDDYNTYALKWTPDYYAFYVNGVFTHYTTKGVSQVDQYIILSEEPFWWDDLPDSVRNGAAVRDTFRVDYVRVYQKKSETSVRFERKEKSNAKSFILKQNYPNPFNPATSITYALPADDFVTLKVFDVLGQEVATLVNEKETAGAHTIAFDGSHLASGVYYCKLKIGDHSSQTIKMLMVK